MFRILLYEYYMLHKVNIYFFIILDIVQVLLIIQFFGVDKRSHMLDKKICYTCVWHEKEC